MKQVYGQPWCSRLHACQEEENWGPDMLCSLKPCMQMQCRKVYHSGSAGWEEDCG